MRVLDSSIHEVRDNDLVKYLKRVYPKLTQELISWVNLITGRWCVGTWLHEGTGTVREITGWPAYQQPSQDEIDTVMYNLRPDTTEAYLRYWLEETKNIRRREAQAQADDREKWIETLDRWRKLVKPMWRDHPMWDTLKGKWQ